jgi:hypothetical protein
LPRRKISIIEQLLPGVSKLDLPAFSAGVVCDVLDDFPAWRLHNFLKTYSLSAKEPGKGQRLWFSQEQVYRLAIAKFLADDGFSAPLISEVFESIDDRDFFQYDEHDRVPHPVIAFWRTQHGKRFRPISQRQAQEVRLGSPIYYLLDVAKIVDNVDERIRQLKPGFSPTLTRASQSPRRKTV